MNHLLILLSSIVYVTRDGTSIILSDEVGQLYILSTGQGEAQNDAKYDQVYNKNKKVVIIDWYRTSQVTENA